MTSVAAASEKMMRLQGLQLQIIEITGRDAESGDEPMSAYFGWESEYAQPDSDEEQEQEEDVDGDPTVDEWS